jgi:hypothetical protein
MASNQYILVSELPPGLTNEQRLLARDGVGQLGGQSTASPNAVGQPSNVNHSRTSLDGTQILFQAMFEDDEITRENIVATIAEALSLPVVAVDAVVGYQVLGPKPAGKNYILANVADWE